MTSYRTEFPDFDPATMPTPALPADFVDTSWRNDMCPSFTSDARGLTVWIDFADPKAREFEDSPRFSVQPQDHGVETSGPSLDTDDWSTVLAFIGL